MKDKYLLSSNDDQILYFENLALTNVRILNSVNELIPIPDEASARKVVGDCNNIYRQRLEAHPNFKHMKGFDLLAMDGLQVPNDIQRLKAAIEALRQNLTIRINQLPMPSGFQFAKHEGGTWVIDRVGLDAWNQKYLFYVDADVMTTCQKIVDGLNALPSISNGEKVNLMTTPVSRYDAATDKMIVDVRYFNRFR